jgi:DNA mismatch repair protein MutS2
VNAHALQVLEFEAAVRAVAGRCASELGRAALLDRGPGTDLPRLRAELAAVAQTLELHGAHPSWSPPSPPDARRPLKVLDVEGGVLASEELLLVLRLLEAGGTLSDGLGARMDDDAEPHLPALRKRLLRAPAEVERLTAIVDDDGEIRDGASPALRQLRRGSRSARTRIVRRLEAFVASLPSGSGCPTPRCRFATAGT